MTPRIKTIFFASLLLNVVLAGIMLGMASGHMGRKWHDSYDQSALESLPPETRKLFDSTVEKARTDNRQIWKQMRELREETLHILQAASFDAAAYQQHMDKMRELRDQAMQHKADAVKELAGALPADQRAKLADMLSRPHGRPDWKQCDKHTKDNNSPAVQN